MNNLTSFLDKSFGGGFSNVVSKVKGAMMNYTEYQRKVDEATNNDKCILIYSTCLHKNAYVETEDVN